MKYTTEEVSRQFDEGKVLDFKKAKDEKLKKQFQVFVDEFYAMMKKHNIKANKDLINLFLNDIFAGIKK